MANNAIVDFPSHAVALNIQLVHAKNQTQECATKAAKLRRDAKASSSAVDAHNMRKQAKELTERSKAQRAIGKKLQTELTHAVIESSKLLTAKLPPAYAEWGVIKTRAYLRLLTVLSRQAEREKPNTTVATEAIKCLQAHATWSDRNCAAFSVLKPTAKQIT